VGGFGAFSHSRNTDPNMNAQQFRILLPGLFLGLLLSASPARSDTLVLVHGYLGDALSWERSGVLAVLAQAGWTPRAVLRPRSDGRIQEFPNDMRPQPHRSYRVELPFTAPVLVQSSALASALQEIRRRHPDEALHIAAHSLGGLVVRDTLVRNPKLNAHTIITIAAPHLGTPLARTAREITSNGPTSIAARMLAGEQKWRMAKQSDELLRNLDPSPNGYLAQLAKQPLPPGRWISVVRSADDVVPTWSQSLYGHPIQEGAQIEIVVTPPGHSLRAEDGLLIRTLITESMRATRR
jgi:pimeloyl-ACP methyl ester carboxylesterase